MRKKELNVRISSQFSTIQCFTLDQRFPNFYSLCPPLKCSINVAPPSTQINSNTHIWCKVQLTNLQAVITCTAYSLEPVLVLCDKQNISSKQSAYWNIYFTLTHISFKIHMSLIQSTWAPSWGPMTPPPRRCTPQFETLCSICSRLSLKFVFERNVYEKSKTTISNNNVNDNHMLQMRTSLSLAFLPFCTEYSAL
jgi:hypothetical protein